MNMTHTIGAMDVAVFTAMAFALLFTIAWAVSPRLREWIERPKYRFQENLKREEGRR